MSLLVSACTNGKAPLIADRWAKDLIGYLTTVNDHAISQDKFPHYKFRDVCVDTITSLLDLQGPRVKGYQTLRQEQLSHSLNVTEPDYQLMGVQDGRNDMDDLAATGLTTITIIPQEQLQWDMLQWDYHTRETKAHKIHEPVQQLVKLFKEKDRNERLLLHFQTDDGIKNN
jgi:hypothetical protein